MHARFSILVAAAFSIATQLCSANEPAAPVGTTTVRAKGPYTVIKDQNNSACPTCSPADAGGGAFDGVGSGGGALNNGGDASDANSCTGLKDAAKKKQDEVDKLEALYQRQNADYTKAQASTTRAAAAANANPVSQAQAALDAAKPGLDRAIDCVDGNGHGKACGKSQGGAAAAVYQRALNQLAAARKAASDLTVAQAAERSTLNSAKATALRETNSKTELRGIEARAHQRHCPE